MSGEAAMQLKRTGEASQAAQAQADAKAVRRRTNDLTSRRAVLALGNLIANSETQDDMAWLRQCAAQTLASGLRKPLHIAMGLPTWRQLRRQARNEAVLQSLPLLADNLALDSGAVLQQLVVFRQAAALHAVLLKIATRGKWKAWNKANGPPVDAPELERQAYVILNNGKRDDAAVVPSEPTLRSIITCAAEQDC